LNKYREDEWIDICRSLDYRDGKSFWSRFQQITGQKKHSNHHVSHQNQILNTPQEKASCFAQILQQIHQVPDDPHFDNRFFNKVTQNVTNFFKAAPNPPEYTLAVFLDIKRAFDKVWRDGLLQKFISLQANPLFIRMIKSFLENRTCSVQVRNQNSAPIQIHAGVPQRSALSPILYLVYCSDFPVSDTPRTKTRMFVDDTTLWTCSKNPEFAQKTIQRKLQSVERWTNSWRVKPNPLKSQSILMQDKNHHNTNSPISASTIYQSLNKKRFATSVSHSPTTAPSTQTSNKPSRNRANLLYHIRGRIHGCHSKPLNHTYKTFIRPIVDYRAPIYASLPQKNTQSNCSL
jgi:hypothetical protein